MLEPRIRVTQFLTNLALGGTEKQVVKLAGALDPARYDVDIAVLQHDGELKEEVSQLGVPVTEYPVNALARLGTLRRQFQLASDLRRRGIHIVHSYNFYANVFAVPAARLAGVPCVLGSIRDTGVYLNDSKRRLQRLACRFAHRIVVNADAIRDWLVEDGYDPERVVTIPNGIDVGEYMVPRGKHGLRDELGIPRTAPLVVMLARVNRKKGIDYLVEAAAMLSARHPDAHFVVVGGNFEGPRRGSEVPYRHEVEQAATRLGISSRLHFTGFRDDVPAILAEADVSVLPSLSEGLSNTLLESMAAGVPVVTTRVGGTPELIQDGAHGLLVAPRDAPALAAAIGWVFDNPDAAKDMGQRARKLVTERYSVEQMARETEAQYEELLLSHSLSVARSQ